MISAKRVSLFAISAFVISCAASLAFAQQPAKVRLPQASPSATVSQTIGITDIAITYHRPAVRGRMLWGDISSDKVAALIKANSDRGSIKLTATSQNLKSASRELRVLPVSGRR